MCWVRGNRAPLTSPDRERESRRVERRDGARRERRGVEKVKIKTAVLAFKFAVGQRAKQRRGRRGYVRPAFTTEFTAECKHRAQLPPPGSPGIPACTATKSVTGMLRTETIDRTATPQAAAVVSLLLCRVGYGVCNLIYSVPARNQIGKALFTK